MSIVVYPVTTPWEAMEVLIQVKDFMQLRFKFYRGLNINNTIGIHYIFICSLMVLNKLYRRLDTSTLNYLKL